MPAVSVNTYTHSVTYVADNILKSFKDIINLSGLDPSNFVGGWQSHLLAIQTWLASKHLRTVFLEIYDPRTDKLITRWDMDVVYSWSTGDGSFYTDTDQIRYAIRKVGLIPSQALYKLQFDCAEGWPDVPGWSRTGRHRSTAGMVRQSLGSTIEHYGLGSSTSFWRNS